MARNPQGLSRQELEYEARWLLRKVKSEVDAPTMKVMENLVDVVITLIDKNNAALARRLETRESPDVGDEY